MLVQDTLVLSPYSGLYDILVPKDHFLRKFKELVNFEFIYDELKDKYSIDNGRPEKKIFKWRKKENLN